MSVEEERYNMSFTAGAALLNETCAVAKALLDCDGDWDATQEKTFSENLLEKSKASTMRRTFYLVKQRLMTMNQDELSILVNGNMSDRRLIDLLAICKTHAFIYEFIADEVRTCFYGLKEKVTHGDFNTFFNDKKYIHPELEKISDQSAAKVRQVTFRILEQLGLIESVRNGIIRRPFVPEEIEKVIVKDNPRWLAIYLYKNDEITKAKQAHE